MYQPSAPAWSPDGRTLYFGASVKTTTQLFAVPASGGTPRALTERAGRDRRGHLLARWPERGVHLLRSGASRRRAGRDARHRDARAAPAHRPQPAGARPRARQGGGGVVEEQRRDADRWRAPLSGELRAVGAAIRWSRTSMAGRRARGPRRSRRDGATAGRCWPARGSPCSIRIRADRRRTASSSCARTSTTGAPATIGTSRPGSTR